MGGKEGGEEWKSGRLGRFGWVRGREEGKREKGKVEGGGGEVKEKMANGMG